MNICIISLNAASVSGHNQLIYRNKLLHTGHVIEEVDPENNYILSGSCRAPHSVSVWTVKSDVHNTRMAAATVGIDGYSFCLCLIVVH